LSYFALLIYISALSVLVGMYHTLDICGVFYLWEMSATVHKG